MTLGERVGENKKREGVKVMIQQLNCFISDTLSNLVIPRNEESDRELLKRQQRLLVKQALPEG
jgi:hypothetical protein